MSRTITLGVLESIRIASPCGADWNTMTGDDRARFCSQCRLHVYNLSAMTREEAEKLIAEKEGRLCARLYRRADGTVLTRDCPRGLRALRMRMTAGAARLAAAIACLLGSGIALGAGPPGWGIRLRQMQPFSTICEWIRPAPIAVPPPNQGRVIMGAVCAPPAPLLIPSPGNKP